MYVRDWRLHACKESNLLGIQHETRSVKIIKSEELFGSDLVNKGDQDIAGASCCPKPLVLVGESSRAEAAPSWLRVLQGAVLAREVSTSTLVVFPTYEDWSETRTEKRLSEARLETQGDWIELCGRVCVPWFRATFRVTVDASWCGRRKL